MTCLVQGRKVRKRLDPRPEPQQPPYVLIRKTSLDTPTTYITPPYGPYGPVSFSEHSLNVRYPSGFVRTSASILSVRQ